MTKKEIFNTVSKHLLAQNCQSQRDYGNRICLYRGPNETKCAVGCLIPDHLYSQNLEGNSCTEDIILNVLKASGIDMNDGDIFNLVAQLQHIHDYYHPHNWATQLKELKAEFEL